MREDEIAAAIHDLRRRASEDIVEIGRLLVEAKELLDHGDWYPWLKAEFAWSRQTADNYIRVFETFGDRKTLIVSVLEPTALYALSQRSAPPQALTAVTKLIKAGTPPTTAGVKKLIREIKSLPDVSPDVPPEPEKGKSVREVAFAEKFRAAVASLVELAARPSKLFVGAVSAGDLDMVANFLKQIAARQVEAVEHDDQKGEKMGVEIPAVLE